MRHAARSTFGQQHGDDVFGRVVGKELALVLLVPGNAVVLQQGDEVLRREPRQRRAAELRVLADEVLVRRARIEIAIGEVAAPAARDADFFGHLVGVVDQQHAQPALASLAGAEQAGGAGTDHDGVKYFHEKRVPAFVL